MGLVLLVLGTGAIGLLIMVPVARSNRKVRPIWLLGIVAICVATIFKAGSEAGSDFGGFVLVLLLLSMFAVNAAIAWTAAAVVAWSLKPKSEIKQ